jgi:exosortase A
MSVVAAPSMRARSAPLRAAGWVTLCVLILHLQTFASMVSIWSRDATFAHGFAIPLICLWLLWQRREALAAVTLEPARGGFVCCAALTGLWLLADLADVQAIAQGAATAMLPAALWAVLGTQFVRRAAFPLVYLAFAVPWGDIFVPSLMRFTTEFTVGAVRLVGVPIYRDGNFFSLPSGNFEVVKACSGVRYLIASLALGVLYAGISYRSWRRRAAFIGLSIVVPIIANGLRAFGIVMIAHSSQMKYAVGIDHLIYGWLFFGVVMALLFWMGNAFAEPVAGPSAAPSAPVPTSGFRLGRRGVALLLLVLLAGPLLERGLMLASRGGPLGSAAPAGAAGSKPLQGEWRPAFAQTAEASSGRYDSPRGAVLFFTRAYRSDELAPTELSARALVIEETGAWRVARSGVIELSNGVRVGSAQIVGQDGAQLEVWFWRLIGGQVATGAVDAVWLRLRSWLRLEEPVTNLIAVAALGLEREPANALLRAYLEQSPELLGGRRVP